MAKVIYLPLDPFIFMWFHFYEVILKDLNFFFNICIGKMKEELSDEETAGRKRKFDRQGFQTKIQYSI